MHCSPPANSEPLPQLHPSHPQCRPRHLPPELDQLGLLLAPPLLNPFQVLLHELTQPPHQSRKRQRLDKYFLDRGLVPLGRRRADQDERGRGGLRGEEEGGEEGAEEGDGLGLEAGEGDGLQMKKRVRSANARKNGGERTS